MPPGVFSNVRDMMGLGQSATSQASSSAYHNFDDRYEDQSTQQDRSKVQDKNAITTGDLTDEIKDQITQTLKSDIIRPVRDLIKKDVMGQGATIKAKVDTFMTTYPYLKTAFMVAGGITIFLQIVPEQLANLYECWIANNASCLRIEAHSELYPVIVKFISEYVPPRERRHGTVKTKQDLDLEAYHNDQPTQNTNRPSTPRISIVYTPDDYCQVFKFQGQSFWCTGDNTGAIIVWHMSRSTEKIMGMLNTLQDATDKQKKSTSIEIYREKLDENKGMWEEQKPAKKRDMKHVCLEPVGKRELIEDLDSYLDPATVGWYTVRGIPRRRRLLLHGPPGCGKTSLIQAVAAKYDLKIREVKVSAPGMTDAILLTLFQELGAGDLVLLEDIDCAGMATQRKDGVSGVDEEYKEPENPDLECNYDDSDEGSEASSHHSSQQYYTFTESDSKSTAKSRHSSQRTTGVRGSQVKESHGSRQNPPDHAKSKGKAAGALPRSSVTLSGLLNAIDRVSAPSGHVLFMTSNHPDKLDKALKRAGRIDREIKLDYAHPVSSRQPIRVLPPKPERASEDSCSLPAYDQTVTRQDRGGNGWLSRLTDLWKLVQYLLRLLKSLKSGCKRNR